MNSITLEGLVGSGELWLDIMRIICGDTCDMNMVDLGSYHAPYTPKLGFQHRTYVDIQQRPLDNKEEQQYFVQDDIIHYLESVERGPNVFILSDVLEHFSFMDGYKVINLMCMKGYKNIIFTPYGDYCIQRNEDGNPDAHRSGWIPEMLSAYASIVLPHFHQSVNAGAFFAFNCNPLETERIVNEIKAKYVEN